MSARDSVSPTPWILLKNVYIRQGINIAGYQNRIYSTGPTWDIHLHPDGTLIQLIHRPDGSRHYISTTVLESAEALPLGSGGTQGSGGVDHTGLVANQVRHAVVTPAPISISPPIALDEEVKEVTKALIQEHEAKEHHLSSDDSNADPAPSTQTPPQALKKKRGRPRKAPQLISTPG